MSWPDDGEPRFVVSGVTGYPISQTGRTSRSASIATAVQVLDRAYAHRVVREFRPGVEIGVSREGQRFAKAHAYAADLNRQDAEGLLERDLSESDTKPGVFA